MQAKWWQIRAGMVFVQKTIRINIPKSLKHRINSAEYDKRDDSVEKKHTFRRLSGVNEHEVCREGMKPA
jgi:hypothetical protein